MQHILSHIQNARLALSVGNIGSAEAELGCAAKLVEEKFKSTNSAMDAILALYKQWESTIPKVQHLWGAQEFIRWAQEQHQ